MESRRAKRRHLFHYLEVHDQKEDHKLLGHVADLTLQGLLLVGAAPMDAGEKLDIQIEIPDSPGFEGEFIKTTAIVKWNGKDRNPALHCVGLEFVDVGPREQSNIELLYKFMGFRD